MKTLAGIITFILCLSTSLNAQHKSCCQKSTSCNSMVAFVDDQSFKDAHLAPKEYVHQNHLGERITFNTPDGKPASAYQIKATEKSDKWLFVIHEWWGLNDYIIKESEKLYNSFGGKVNVIALDLFNGKIAKTADSASYYTKVNSPESVTSIIQGAIQYVGPQAKIASIGWCYGGGWSLQTSILAASQSIGCVMYYGSPESDINKLKQFNGELLGIFALQDQYITPAAVTNFEKNLKAAKVKYTIKNYDAVHAFANPSNPNYNAEYAQQAYDMSVTFLKRMFGV
jgi:carboxymethylenebutenolidase